MKTTRLLSNKPLFLILILSIILIVPACQPEEGELQEEVSEQVDLDTSVTQVMDETAEPEVQAGLSAAVVIDENTIGIEEIVEPGPTVLTIRNSGLKQHSLAVTGPGGSWQLENFLEPEGVGNLEVVFQEGTYRVYDPLDETLSTEVEVRPAATE